MFNRLFLSFLLLSVFADAETLFYKKDGSPITPQEHDVIYKIMLETQFPMSVAYGNYYEDEIKAMNEKIQKQLPNAGIEVTFIPTTLYQMLCLNYLRDNLKQIEQATFGILIYKKMPTLFTNSTDMVVSMSFTSFEVISHFKEINLHPPLIQWHSAINSYIVSLLKEKNITLPISFDDTIKMVKSIDFWHGEIVYPSAKSAPWFQAFSIIAHHKNILVPSDMMRAIAIEYNAFSANNFLLYRGSNYVDDFHDQRISKNRSISFGSSLLGGILFDSSACPYYHMITSNKFWQKNLGYVVFINKAQYTSGLLNNMFFIPPLTTLLDLIGHGELFHSRTKGITITDLSGLLPAYWNNKSLIPYFQIKAANQEEAQITYNQILQYIKDHHLIFRERTSARL